MTLADISKLNIPLEFGCDFDTEETESIIKVYDQLDNTVTTTFGVSKFVIFLNDSTVVKIPFNGHWDQCDNTFKTFINQDYCAIEESVYADAVAAGVEIFFAQTMYGGKTAKFTPYYISERVYNFYSSNVNKVKFSEDSLNKAKKTNIIDTGWLAYAYEYYGEDLVKQLIIFLTENEISDLHNDNLGFRKNGEPVILDYSDFNEYS